MSIEILQALPVWYIIFCLYLLLYGVAFGCSNIIMKVSAILTGRAVLQNDLGKFLDALWVVGIIVAYILYPEVTV